MLVNSSNSASSAVTCAIQQASQATGASFNYLLATAQVESGLNPQAGASTSSARGLFQFIETTWLATIKQAGAALGFGRYADAITQTASGNYEVRDPTMRSEILKLRNDPKLTLNDPAKNEGAKRVRCAVALARGRKHDVNESDRANHE